MKDGLAEELAAKLAGLYFVGITVGRGIAGFVTAKLTDVQLARVGEGIMVLGILVMLLTYASVAIWKDAYVRVREKEGSAIGWAVFLGISLLIGWNDWIELAMSILCFYTAGLIALRRFLRKREEDNG